MDIRIVMAYQLSRRNGDDFPPPSRPEKPRWRIRVRVRRASFTLRIARPVTPTAVPAKTQRLSSSNL
ncbi:MAG: hypothetical protein AAFU54_10105 [Chloroflexota bacterium]